MGQFFNGFFGLNGVGRMPIEVESAIFDNFWLWIAAIALCLPIRSFIREKADRQLCGNTFYVGYGLTLTRTAISVAIIAMAVVLLVGATNNAFLYTRF